MNNNIIKYQHFDFTLFFLILIIAVLLIVINILWIKQSKIEIKKIVGSIITIIIVGCTVIISYNHCYIKKDVQLNLYKDAKRQTLIYNNELVGSCLYDIGYKYNDKELFRTVIMLKSGIENKDYIISYKVDNDAVEKKFLLGNNIEKYDFDYQERPKNYGQELYIDLSFKIDDLNNGAIIKIYDTDLKLLSTLQFDVNQKSFSVRE